MVEEEVLVSIKSEIEALPDEMAYSPHKPVNDLIRQGTELLTYVTQDMEMLSGIGINNERVFKLEPCMEALRDYNSAWNDSKLEAEEARIKWNNLLPEAEDLKKELLQTLRFVYDGDEKMETRLSQITEGDGYDDLISDLHDIAYVGKKDLTIFEPLNYDVSLFDRSEQLSSELLILLGQMNGEKQLDNKIKQNRDKAFNYLKELLAYIRKYGKYAFRNNSERATLYMASNYN